MSISLPELVFYAGASVILFLTPGPVWIALTARSLAGGFASAWPLAVGVALGDLVWPLTAIFGMTWIAGSFGDVLSVLHWLAAVMFLVMGALAIRNASRPVNPDNRLLRPGAMAGFTAGVAVILGNPKAILFYMGALPGFFDLSALSTGDIAAIIAVSAAVPLVGNLAVALGVDRVRALLSSPQARRRTNLTAGWLLVLVGVMIPFI